MHVDWDDLARIDWHAIEAIGTLSLALITFVTVGFLLKASLDQTKALGAQEQALAAQKSALETNVMQAISSELLTLGRWLADNQWYRCGLEAPEDKYTRWGEDAATVYADFMDHVTGLWDRLPDQYRVAYEPWIVGRLTEYPQIRKFVSSHSDWYGQALKGYVKRASSAVDSKTDAVLHADEPQVHTSATPEEGLLGPAAEV